MHYLQIMVVSCTIYTLYAFIYIDAHIFVTLDWHLALAIVPCPFTIIVFFFFRYKNEKIMQILLTIWIPAVALNIFYYCFRFLVFSPLAPTFACFPQFTYQQTRLNMHIYSHSHAIFYGGGEILWIYCNTYTHTCIIFHRNIGKGG